MQVLKQNGFDVGSYSRMCVLLTPTFFLLLFLRSWTLSVLLYGFYLSWIVNMALNMTWLLLWDQECVTVF